MTSLPQGQNYYDPVSFLGAWEERYGKLTERQQSRFLHDSRLIEILLFPKYSVESSLDKFKKFEDILEDLNFKLRENYDYVEITPEDLGMANHESGKGDAANPDLSEFYEFYDPELLQPEPWEREPKTIE